MKSEVIFIFLLIIIIIIGLALANWQRKDYNRHPKKIWTYLNNPDKVQKTIKICLESWKKHNSDYEITILTKKNYFSYVNIPVEIAEHPNFNDNSTRFSELVRLYTLAEHGGVWIDASILVKKPLDDWLFPKYAEFSGFYLEAFTKEGLPPIIENYFFGCNKGCEFLKKWRNEFIEIARFPNVEKYIESRKKMGIDFQKIHTPISLAQHIAVQKVLQLDSYSLETLILRKAEDGPLKYLVDAKWDSEKALNLACLDKKYQTPILMMRDCEEKIMEEKLQFDLSEERCHWLN